ncbi:dihydroxyacetone kinase subunit DhaK [Vagococcus xieshaowenii]|uniref:phosphoenolpyruvate--glycerone phosphotransferase n=1 Tax=Vagococcus xieshaowenii TaxID=2562451 RepID=A0AAJ5EFA4_9ENTE|nr:dihydroxyacetone kinase subunit DhaK [Vagococcus xieshaowenii]QCA29428.1 dihydroxyacetone kinase subunit DhaK [Vagococcus xieshaowenii]TFZ41548.1 dihydroxyacetone kinase subunit DhaK [Vagococcus xieshaowenii]
MKRLVNDGYQVVEEMLEGYVLANNKYAYLDDENQRVVLSKQMSAEPRVRVIVGGGSGHEPLFLGYVGKDFADAAVVGNINTSPAPDACLRSVQAVDSGKGCIFLYGNYAGDVMNFDMAVEMAAEEGIRVETVLVTDDVCSAKERENRRGIAGDVPVFKVAGSAAAKGYDLDKVTALTQKANDSTYSMGVALSSSTLPVTGKDIFFMEDGDMEIGMGIHGEPGLERRKIDPADKVVDEIMENILADAKLEQNDEVYVLLNGLGGLPVMDQYICYRRVHQILEEKGIKIHRTDVGNYATSMDMIGMSVTLLKLDDEIKELLDAPCDTPYYKL